MYQVYFRFDDEKNSEEFNSYDEAQNRFDELAWEFTEHIVAYLAIINSEGSTVKEVRK